MKLPSAALQFTVTFMEIFLLLCHRQKQGWGEYKFSTSWYIVTKF